MGAKAPQSPPHGCVPDMEHLPPPPPNPEQIGPDGVYVLRTEHPLKEDVSVHLRAQWEKQHPGVPLAILPPTMKLDFVGPGEAQEPPARCFHGAGMTEMGMNAARCGDTAVLGEAYCRGHLIEEKKREACNDALYGDLPGYMTTNEVREMEGRGPAAYAGDDFVAPPHILRGDEPLLMEERSRMAYTCPPLLSPIAWDRLYWGLGIAATLGILAVSLLLAGGGA